MKSMAAAPPSTSPTISMNEAMATDIHPNTASVIERDHSVLEMFGIEVTHARDGHCRLTAVAAERWVNAAGFTHGAVAFTLLDTACAYALASLETLGVTVNANVSYVKGAQLGDQMIAQVQLQSRTRRLATLIGHVRNPRDELLAHGSFMFQQLERR